MDAFLNVLKAQSGQLDQRGARPRLGVVSSVDVEHATVRVTIQPENVLSGWLPIAAPWVGDGWGMVCPPSPGDQVIIVCQEGDAEHGIVMGRLWSDAIKPPAAPSGEFWLVHKSGSYLKFHNDGTIESNAGNWVHHGDFHVGGDIFDGHGALSALRGHYNQHTHPPSGALPQPVD